jgi:hypothetical protein
LKEDEIDGACSTHENEIFMQLENLQTRDHLENLGIDVSVILKRILNKYGAGCRQDFSGSGWGPVAGCCKHGNELNCSFMAQTVAPLVCINKISYRSYMFRHHAIKVHLLVSEQFRSIKMHGLNNIKNGSEN